MTRRHFWLWYAAGVAAFLPVLRFHYVGEEAIFPIGALEMWFHGEYLRKLIFGADLQQNPLFNWVIMAICPLVGWEWMLEVARVVAISSTVGSGLVLAWCVRRLTGDADFAAFTALVHLLLADVALYRGWLAYVDPLFGFFVFSSMACLWVACHERRLALLAVAVVSLTLGYLAKTFTAYVFYGITACILLFDRDARRFLLSPASLVIHAAGAAALAVWIRGVHGGTGQGTRLFKEIIDKLVLEEALRYLGKLFAYPAETLLKTAPASLLALYYGWRRRMPLGSAPPLFRTAVAIAFFNYLPYWLAPHSHSRYLVPIYPVAALVFAWMIWNARPASLAVTVRWFAGFLVFKLILAIVVMPYYQKVYRGENYELAARDIFKRTKGHPLYAADVSASGLSVTAYLDILRLPAAPLVLPPAKWETGFVLAYTPDAELGRVVEEYRLGGNYLYLLCRGDACPRDATTIPPGK